MRASSDASSSISVTSVPTEVTGDGPTISLGLIKWLFIEDDRPAAEDGRRELDSMELADLRGLVVSNYPTSSLLAGTYNGRKRD